MKFTDSHEWIRIEEGIGVVGITSYAQKELGEVVYVELPQIGKRVRLGEETCVLESTKAAADIYAPMSGEVIAVNENLRDTIGLLNASPQQEGWLFKLKLSRPDEERQLLSTTNYEMLIQK